MTYLAKHDVFRPWVQTLADVKFVGYIWVFVRKLNEHSKITGYNAQLDAQGFLQKLSTDYDDKYSSVIDAIIFRFLLA